MVSDPINTIGRCGCRQALIQACVIHQDIRGAKSEPGSNASLSHAKRASIVAAHMAQQNEGNVGHPVTEPASTMTSKVCHQNVVTSHMLTLRQNGFGQPIEEPLPNFYAAGNHHSTVHDCFDARKCVGWGTRVDVR